MSARTAASPPASRRRRDAVALSGALVLHLGAGLGAWHFHGNAPAEPHDRRTTAVEVDVIPLPAEASDPLRDGTPRTESPVRLASRTRSSSPRVFAPSTPDGSELGSALPAPNAEGPAPVAPAASASAPTIDLGLQGGITLDALRDPRFGVEEAPKPSIGLLAEGLARSDAAKGLSRSSVAVSAGYRAADALAPPAGLALFEVRADSSGAVVSVHVVSEGPDQARWAKVAEAMRHDLAKRKVRVPPGAAGMVTRLRVERGQHASDPAAMSRLDRGPAMGQGALPPGQAADESTQQSLGRGLTPTVQVYSSDKKARATRVVVVSERLL